MKDGSEIRIPYSTRTRTSRELARDVASTGLGRIRRHFPKPDTTETFGRRRGLIDAKGRTFPSCILIASTKKKTPFLCMTISATRIRVPSHFAIGTRTYVYIYTHA